MANKTHKRFGSALTRRRLLRGAGLLGAGLAFPHVWIPRPVKATSAF